MSIKDEGLTVSPNDSKPLVVCQWGLSRTNVRLKTEQKFLKTKKAKEII